MTIARIYNGRNILGEGPLWDQNNQKLYWVDINQACIFQLNLPTQQLQYWFLPESACAIALQQENLLITFQKSFGFLNLVTGKTTSWITPALKNNEVFNDGKCDRMGRFWIGSKDRTEKSPIGALYRLDPDGTFIKMDEGFIVSNGLGWSPNNQYFYFTDGDLHRQILRYDFNLESGTITNRKVFAKIPEELGYPDGLTVDSDGYVWSAHWDGWRITRYDPEGKVERIIAMPVQKPTSCCFGGENLQTLFITSATRDLSQEVLLKQPDAGKVFALDTEIKGLPSFNFGNE